MDPDVHRVAWRRERELGLAFVKANDAIVWQEYAQVLLGSNEFQFVD